MEWSEISSKQAAASIKAEGETCSGGGNWRWSGCRWLRAHSMTSLTEANFSTSGRRGEKKQDKTRRDKRREEEEQHVKAAESEATQMEGARQGPGRRQGEANQPRRRPSEITNALNLAARVEQLQQRHVKLAKAVHKEKIRTAFASVLFAHALFPCSLCDWSIYNVKMYL